jgi:hypothetical protein
MSTIRTATISDSEPIARELWDVWQQFKIRQIPSSMHKYASYEALAGEIRANPGRWLVCESLDEELSGFFSLSPVGHDKSYEHLGFPEHAVRIDDFACLQPGEALLRQFQLLTSHLPSQSILLVIPAQLRDAYRVALKAGFRQLGDSPLLVGAYSWLYLDRESRLDEVQTKLQRAKMIG